MTLREAAQQALAYLDGAAYAFEVAADGRAVSFAAYGKNCRDAAAALRAALAEPVQPVACDKDPQGCWNVRCQLGKVCKNTTPPQRKPRTA